jgi:Ulp1 family protease
LLAHWYDSRDKNLLLAGLFLSSIETGELPSTTIDCRLLATDFLCLRPSEWLNDSIMDAGLNTICCLQSLQYASYGSTPESSQYNHFESHLDKSESNQESPSL